MPDVTIYRNRSCGTSRTHSHSSACGIEPHFIVTAQGTKLYRPSKAILEILSVQRGSPFTKEDGEALVDSGARRA